MQFNIETKFIFFPFCLQNKTTKESLRNGHCGHSFYIKCLINRKFIYLIYWIIEELCLSKACGLFRIDEDVCAEDFGVLDDGTISYRKTGWMNDCVFVW